MLKKALTTVAFLGLSATGFAQGHGHGHSFSILEVNDAVRLAIGDFKADKPLLSEKLFAFQGAISGEIAAVKLYTKEDGATVKYIYECHNHDGDVECHYQGN